MSRSEAALRAPGDLNGFPTSRSTPAVLYRAHNPARSPWWFSSDGSGRFDLRGAEGTCYLASDVATGIRESFGPLLDDDQAISERQARSKIVSIVSVGDTDGFANLGSKRAAWFGAIRELSTTGDYELTGRWAAALRALPVDGIHYASRFTSGERGNAWAVFGPGGVDDAREVTQLGFLTGADACKRARITVVPNTTSDSLTILEPPTRQTT